VTDLLETETTDVVGPAPGPAKPEEAVPFRFRLTPQSAIREYLSVALWGLPLFLFMALFVAQNFKIPTQSMESTLLIGDHLTVNKFIYGLDSSGLVPARDPRRGDVVVFRWPGDTTQFWVKRLIGVPGDKFEIVNDTLVMNDQELDEPYSFYRAPTRESTRDPEIAYRPVDFYTLKPGLANSVKREGEYFSMEDMIETTRMTLKRFYSGRSPKLFRRLVDRLESGDGQHIPEGFFFVMGDNRNLSWDSRGWGFVPRELMEGRAYWVWWSYGEDENTHLATGLELAKIYLRYPLDFFKRTHWKESMRRIK